MVIAPELQVLIAGAVAAVVALAEWLHARRTRRVARLAFGPGGAPAAWVAIVPVLRTVAAGAATWGLLFLATFDPIDVDRRPARNASKHVLICLDASPSMQIKDAGPNIEKMSRAAWAGRVVQGILDRLDMETTRITIVAFYTDVLPIVEDTFDKEVVRNALDGLPMYVAFEAGPTDVQKGVAKGLEFARPWPRGSATLVVVTDGDANAPSVPARLPDSIANTIVIGVGDSMRASSVSGHSSRQNVTSLKQLAARLGGIYHDGNVRHLPSAVLDDLTMIEPRVGGAMNSRDLALWCAGAGAFTLALAGPMLSLFGRRRSFVVARRSVAGPGGANETVLSQTGAAR
ncbi:MAG: hypothetical protein U0572_01560 [Phycisphaerales bacterium]